jgi:multimeric flavodoxin WrbA
LILGISGSSRANGTTSDVIKYILEQSGQEYEYVSLAGKKNQWLYRLYQMCCR